MLQGAFGYMRLNLWSCLRIKKSSEPVLLQPVEDLLEDRSQYSIILNTETDILHCDTETDILLLTDIFCIEEACVCYKLALYSPWQRL